LIGDSIVSCNAMSDERMPVRPVADMPSVDLLTRRYQGILVRYFRRRGIDPADAMDLVQEVFERLSRPEVLARVDHVEGYLFRTAANVAIEHFRRRRVRLAYPVADHEEAMHRGEEFAADRLIEGRQELELIVAALNELPERMRNIFILARLEHMPRAEIAARLGISKRLVEQQITLATACLADRRRKLT
jgi:RNA polymerase sigma-70 factor (ECF subfamily)